MNKWLFSIVLFSWSGLSLAGSLVFPPAFEGMSISKEMLHQSPAKDGWVLVSIEVDVPEGALVMHAFREDMWEGQLQAPKVLNGGDGLSPEQAFKSLFCLLNKDRQGFSCKSTAEVISASPKVPWIIPIIVMPPEAVQEFTSFITKGPIPASATRVAEPPQQQVSATAYQRQRQVPVKQPIQIFRGPVPCHLARYPVLQGCSPEK